jgi:phosphotransferase system enzyme I (PtsI)
VGVLGEAKRELDGKGIAYDKSLKIGAMVEIPSAAYSLDLIAEHCQFVSIGTNDLIQYLLACDRVNDRIAYLYEPTHPAVLRTLKTIMDSASRTNLEVSICGEMASDGLYLPLILGMGLKRLSIHPKSIAEIKHLVRQVSIGECAALFERVLDNPKSDVTSELRSIYAQLSSQ